MSQYVEMSDFEFEQFKLRCQLRKLMEESGELDRPFDGVVYHSTFCYSSYNDCIFISGDSYGIKDCEFTFPDDETAFEAVQLVGEDRLKKYYFCIPEKDGDNCD